MQVGRARLEGDQHARLGEHYPIGIQVVEDEPPALKIADWGGGGDTGSGAAGSGATGSSASAALFRGRGRTIAREVEECRVLILRDAHLIISGHQRSSAVIRGHQRSSDALT
jgi:hypothetical protein